MHPVHLHAFLAANTSKDIRQCNHYYTLPALCLKQKPRKYNHQQKQSDLRTFTLSNHHSFCPSVSPSPLARDLVESQLLADCELIFYSSEFSLWAALLLIKPPLVLLQSDPSPRHCHLNVVIFFFRFPHIATRLAYPSSQWSPSRYVPETSQNLRMLSRSLSDCKSLLLNVVIQVSQFVSNSNCVAISH